jgi:hypothetical protein
VKGEVPQAKYFRYSQIIIRGLTLVNGLLKKRKVEGRKRRTKGREG